MLPRAREGGGSSRHVADAPAAVAEPALADWIEGIDASFAAAAGAGEAGRAFRLAGTVISLRSAGDAMLDRLGTAFAHLADASGDEPDLTALLWDSRSAGVEPPPLPPTDPDEPRGAVFYAEAGSLQVAYQPGLSLLSALDSQRGIAWFWCLDAASLPFWELAAPLRQILHWWLGRSGLMLLHGAAVGTREGGVLLVGRGGSGKSTSALSCLTSELLYAGDDYVAVRGEPDPWVYSLYSSGKLEPGHATLLTHLPQASFPGDGLDEEKAVFYVHERFPARMCHGFPLRAVLVPRVTGTEPRFLPVKPAEALRALAPSTLLQLHPARPDALPRMARLLQRVPTYSFEAGGSIEEIPKAIERFLHDLPA